MAIVIIGKVADFIILTEVMVAMNSYGDSGAWLIICLLNNNNHTNVLKI